MEFQLLTLFTFLSVALLTSHAVPEAYWNIVFPNTPMSKAIKDFLLPGGGTNLVVNFKSVGEVTPSQSGYRYAATADELRKFGNMALFFLEKDMKQGTKMNFHFTKSTNVGSFLPRQVAEKIPFSSNKLPEILYHFSVKPNSRGAEIMKETITICERPGLKGDEIYCATSLESMIDYSTSKLGKNVSAISTEVEKETQLQKYSIVGVKKMETLAMSDETMVCHKLPYAYAVYYCHKARPTKAYVVSMGGSDGTKAKAVTVCHTDTSSWNPKHVAFQVLKVKPGTTPICHFLQENTIAWIPN